MPILIGDALRWHATYTPGKTAIVSTRGSASYADLWSRAIRLADGLRSLGITSGERVAALLMNGAPYIELYHAAALLGAAVVPLNFRFVGHEIEYVMNHSGARVLVLDAAFAGTVGAIREQLTAPGLRFVVVGEGDSKPAAAQISDAVDYDALIAASSVTEWWEPADPDACFFQGYTSGTTGFPKGCVNPHRPFADCLRRLATIYRITQDDVELVAAPLFHEAPALFALTQTMRGGTLVVTADTAPANLLRLVQDHKVTWAFMVPTMWTTLVMSPEVDKFDHSSLRTLISGGSALQTRTKHALIEKFPSAGLNEFYGGTEVGLVSNLGPEDQMRKVRSVGRPVMGMFVELRDETGKPVPQGEVGEIHIGGSTLIREYYRNPEATARSRSDRGFFTLGDLGRFDEEGYLYIVDRKNDMIISGGENIYPNDIEDVLFAHPGVAMVAVVGAPDERWGEIVTAVVVPKPDAQVDEETLIAHCKERLSGFKVPRRIVFRDQLPLSSFGKILRREVRKEFWEGRDVKV